MVSPDTVSRERIKGIEFITVLQISGCRPRAAQCLIEDNAIGEPSLRP